MHVLTDDRYATRRRLVVALGTFLLVSTFVIRASDAAFVETYTNETSTFSTGTLDLDSPVTAPLFGDDGDDAVFRGIDLNAGATTAGCIDIELATSLDPAVLDDVTFEVESGFLDDGLAEDLTIAVDLLPGACPTAAPTANGDVLSATGLSAAVAAGATDSGWNPEGDETRGFAISVTVDDTATQGASVTDVDLTWAITTTNG